MTAELQVRRRHLGALVVPGSLAALVVVAQIAYPLTGGSLRDGLTISIVVLFAAACIAHAAVTRGVRFAGLVLAATAVPGFVGEVIGVHTGVPFGVYSYADSLGPRPLGVPVVVALAWTMLAWPAAIAARSLVHSFPARVAVGTWALAAADLFLDPQMVGDGHWRWTGGGPHLPGVSDVPLTNLAGWLLVSAVLSFALQTLLDRSGPADDRIPVALYLWLYVGWIVALGAFLDLPAAAAWGALGMGVVAVPLFRVVAVPLSRVVAVPLAGRLRR